MKQLVIIGAGGFGREILEWAIACPAYRKEWEIEGFLDDRPDALDGFPSIGLPVLGNTRDYQPRSNQVFIIALGRPDWRAEVWSRFAERDATFTRLVHESCIVGRRVDLGAGVVLCPGVTLTCDIQVGENTALNVKTAAGHDAVIGRDCQISSYCDITGSVSVGDRVFMGSRVSVIPGKRVGDGSTVGAGSVVVSNIPEGVTVFGNPARVLTRHK